METPPPRIFITASEHLGELIGESRLLIVIDDVWRETQPCPFPLTPRVSAASLMERDIRDLALRYKGSYLMIPDQAIVLTKLTGQ